MRRDLLERDLTGQIIDASFHVYNTLGFGLLEVNYCRAMELAPAKRQVRAEREAPVQVNFEGERIGFYRIDLPDPSL